MTKRRRLERLTTRQRGDMAARAPRPACGLNCSLSSLLGGCRLFTESFDEYMLLALPAGGESCRAVRGWCQISAAEATA